MMLNTLTKLGLAFCLVCLLLAPAAAAECQSVTVSLAVSEIVIHVDEEIRTAGYLVDGKENPGSVFAVTGGRTTVILEAVPVGKLLHANISGGMIILGKTKAVIISQDEKVYVSLSLVSDNCEAEEEAHWYYHPKLRMIAETGSNTLEKTFQQIAGQKRNMFLESSFSGRTLSGVFSS